MYYRTAQHGTTKSPNQMSPSQTWPGNTARSEYLTRCVKNRASPTPWFQPRSCISPRRRHLTRHAERAEEAEEEEYATDALKDQTTTYAVLMR